MDMKQSHPPKKSSSFTSLSSQGKHHEISRNLSLRSLRFGQGYQKKDKDYSHKNTIQEEDRNGRSVQHINVVKDEEACNTDETEASFASLCDDIDKFLTHFRGLEDCVQEESPQPPEIPEPSTDRYVEIVEKEIIKFETGGNKWSAKNDELSLLGAIERVLKLTTALANFSSADPKYYQAMNRAGAVLQHSMSFLEDEFYTLLEDPRTKQSEPGSAGSKSKRTPSFGRAQEISDRCAWPPADCQSTQSTEPTATCSTETIGRLHEIAGAMISAGYVTECCQVFTIARRNTFEAALPGLGFEKVSIDDVLKMPWESLEGEIANWCKAFRHVINVSFASEQDLCSAVFAGHHDISNGLFHNLARGVIVQLLTFVEAICMTKRSAEKLFKVLDAYETLSDAEPVMVTLFSAEAAQDDSSGFEDLKEEISSVRYRLGEAAVAIFCDLENSIKMDASKTPVPGGAVHPLTRYVMNYLKYACEYLKTLEQVFREHKNSERSSSHDKDGHGQGGQESHRSSSTTTNNDGSGRSGSISTIGDDNPFAAQLNEIMEWLHTNLETKSNLYKNLALRSIFFMNNGRYVMQKIKGSAEIHKLLGDTWSRKRSSELRQYHKNYQRETWSRVLACLRDEGLQSRGSVVKPVLKERFKSFNALFDEVYKTQSSWVVSDEQLQSELRVSISAVIVPAYRSFVGRFSQYLDPGRQTDKYVKFGPEDLENYIEDFFSGNHTSMASRKRS